MIIEKRAWPDYFQKVLDGVKNFDLRINDFECKEGDVLLLKEWDPATQKYTGREIKKTVKIVVRTKDLQFWSAEEIARNGYQVIGF